MKLTKIMNLLVLGAALTITAFGCKTKPQGLTPLPGNRPKVGDGSGLDQGRGIGNPTPPDTTPIRDDNRGIAPNAGDNHPNWNQDPTALKAQTLYFEFDKSSIKTSEQSKLEEVANYLKSHGNAAVKVEGNCDERGTEEYNRSLGERRALAAREYLVHLGIEPGRVDTISYGEDKPAESGHSESAWAKNRRDDFVVLTPPNLP